MANYERSHHEEALAQDDDGPATQPVIIPLVLELTMEDIVAGVPFDQCGFRHLSKEAEERSRRFSKVVVVQDKKRRVIKINGGSVDPYYE